MTNDPDDVRRVVARLAARVGRVLGVPASADPPIPAPAAVDVTSQGIPPNWPRGVAYYPGQSKSPAPAREFPPEHLVDELHAFNQAARDIESGVDPVHVLAGLDAGEYEPNLPLPPGTGQELARLRAGAPPAPADVRPVVALRVHEYGNRVTELLDQLDGAAPHPGPFGVPMATVSLRVALAGLRLAAEQALPYREPATNTPPPPEPLRLAALVSALGDAHQALGNATRQAAAQLAEAYHAASRAELVGPPGADAMAEAHGVLRDVVTVHRETTAAGEALAVVAERLERLRRPQEEE